MVDPNPVVSGRGIQKCKEAGIEVTVGVLEEKCRELNEIFVKNQTEQKPFIALKIATTIDGKIATKTGSSKWITNSTSRERVQKLRNRYDAILTGSGTVIADNPSMLCTMPGGKNPIKIVLDTNAKIPADAKIFETGKIILATTKTPEITPPNTEILICPKNQGGKIDLEFLMDKLFQKGIKSILVEAGAKINSAFLKTKLMDKLYHFIAPRILGDNQSISCFEGFDIHEISQTVNITLTDVEKLNGDVIITYGSRP